MRKFLARAGVVVLSSVWIAAPGCNLRDAGRASATNGIAPTAAVTTAPVTSTRPVAATQALPATTQPHAPFAIDDRQTLAYLASDALQGRGIGSAGLEKAAELIARDFQSAGLQPLPGQNGYFQPFEMTTATQIGPETRLATGDRTFTPRADFTPISFSADGNFSGQVVFAGYGITSAEHHYDDYAGIDARNKIVLAMRYEPHDDKEKSRWEPQGWSDEATIASKAKNAKAHGALALLLVNPPDIEPGEDRLLSLAQRPAEGSPDLPILHVKRTVAEELLRRAGGAEFGVLESNMDKTGRPASFALPGVFVAGNVQLVRKRVPVRNVLGYLPGRNRDEYVVVGAHYDHLGHGGVGSLSPSSHAIHHGADDNASGVTAVLMLAARLGREPLPPARSIIFATFTGEEEGLIGSSYFVQHPPVPLSQIVAMVNLDMVGRIRTAEQLSESSASSRPAMSSSTAPATRQTPGVLFVGGAGTAPTFDAIVHRADENSPLVVKDIGKGGLGPSDHMSFALKKIPVLFLFSGLHADYHRPSDTADKINYQGLEEVVDFTSDLLRQIAMMPRQQYVDSADASSERVGMGSVSHGGSRVTLGVVPDYSSMDQPGGVRINGTLPGSPAAKAGLQGGDIIVGFGDKTIDNLYDLSDALAAAKPGQVVKLRVVRGESKQPIELEATLVPRRD
jgi:hypothetical protein